MNRRLVGFALATVTAATIFVPAGAAQADPIGDVIGINATFCPPPRTAWVEVEVEVLGRKRTIRVCVR